MRVVALLTCVLAVGCSRRSTPDHSATDVSATSTQQRPAAAEARFWTWFQQNDARLFAFEANRDAVLDDLGEQLHRVHPDLTFEISPERGGKRELVISAGGIRGAFPAVESLCAAAPAMPHWTVIKFRPRRDPVMNVRFGGVEVAPEDVGYELQRDGAKTAIVLYFAPAVARDEGVMKNIGYLLLDEALGELTVETRVGGIEFREYDPKRHVPRIPRLAADFDSFDRPQQ